MRLSARRSSGLVFLGIFLLLAASLPCLAADLLILTFDDAGRPFSDVSPATRKVEATVITPAEFGIVGKGVRWSDAAPRSPAGGGYAVFDGGSALEVAPSPDFVWPSGQDFTVRFWFKSSGITRPSAGKYTTRMHPFGLGAVPSDNLDVDINDTDGGGHGLLSYWQGGGNPGIATPKGSVGRYTDNRWYHFWLVREKDVITLYIGDEQRRYQRVGSLNATSRIGSPLKPVRVGSTIKSGASGNFALGWLGALDDVRIATEALHPTRAC